MFMIKILNFLSPHLYTKGCCCFAILQQLAQQAAGRHPPKLANSGRGGGRNRRRRVGWSGRRRRYTARRRHKPRGPHEAGVAGGVSVALRHHDDDTSRGPRILRLARVAAGGSIALRQHDDDRTTTQAAQASHPYVLLCFNLLFLCFGLNRLDAHLYSDLGKISLFLLFKFKFCLKIPFEISERFSKFR